MPLKDLGIFTTIWGSKLYGLDTELSDIDYVTVLQETPEQIYGIKNVNKIAQKIEEEEDFNTHVLRRFCYLASKGNPNVLETLFAPKDKILHIDKDFEELFLNNRRMFVGSYAIYRSHLGFADNQIKKLLGKDPKTGSTRRDLISKYGYDVKFASHALRLLYQLLAYFEDEDFKYPFEGDVKDAIMVVKRGEVPYTHFMERYKIVQDFVNAKFLAVTNNKLIPYEADIAKINQNLCEYYHRKFK